MTQLRFDGRSIIVTGAADGLGRTYADLLARLGASLVVNDVDARIEGAAEALRAHGGQVVAVAGDISREETSAALVEAALGAFGRIDGVINNAGICVKKPFMDTPVEVHRRLFEVNYFGALHLCRAVWPVMKAAGYGRIVNVTSTSLYGIEDFGAYAATKGAVLGLTRSIAQEGELLGIKVNLLAPGGATAMVMSIGMDPETIRMMQETASPELAAPIAAWVVHEACTTVGKTYFASGGRSAIMHLGQTSGVSIGNDRDFTRTPIAMTEPGMVEGLVAENSVHSATARRW